MQISTDGTAMRDPEHDRQARVEFMQANMDKLFKGFPWANEMGFHVTDVAIGRVKAVQPFDPKFIGDPGKQLVHGGVITTLLDSLCGLACSTACPERRFVATLDLRIDYMRPADNSHDIIGEAECYHITKSVAFARGLAYHETRDKMIATAQSVFAINMPRDHK